MCKPVLSGVVLVLWAALVAAQPQRPQAPQRTQLEHVQRMQLRNTVREQRVQFPQPPAWEQDNAMAPRQLSAEERRALRQQLRELRDQGVPLPPPSQ